MRASIIRFARQISASTGKPYKYALSKKLEARGFQSPYWITSTGLKLLGIGLCERDTKGSCKYNNLELLNADQTTDPEKVQKYAGRIEPRWAVTQRLIQATEVLLTNGADNLWLTKIEIEKIGLNLTEGAVSRTIHLESDASQKPLEIYSIENIIERERLIQCLTAHKSELPPSHFKKRLDEILPLFRDWIHKHFKSALWLTLAEIQRLNIKIKDGDLPTCVHPKDRKKYNVYNADQLLNKRPLNDYIAMHFVDIQVRRTSKLSVIIREEAVKLLRNDPILEDLWLINTIRGYLSPNLLIPIQKRVTIYCQNGKFELLNILHLRPFEYYRIVTGVTQLTKVYKTMYTQQMNNTVATLDGLCFKSGHLQSCYSPDFVKALSQFITLNNLEHKNLLTSAFIAKIGAKVRDMEKAFCLQHDKKEILVYTDDQLTDTKPFLHNLAWALPQVSGYNGRQLPKDISDRLAQYTKNYAFFSRFWFSYKKAKEMDAMLPGTKFCITKNSENSNIVWINASQMKPFAMKYCEKRLTNYEEYLRKMRSKVK